MSNNWPNVIIYFSRIRFHSNCVFIALPSKPLNIIALSDADSASALSLVKQKLHDAHVEVDLGREETAYVERLGGRAEDLESVRLRGSGIYFAETLLAARPQSQKWNECAASGRGHHSTRRRGVA